MSPKKRSKRGRPKVHQTRRGASPPSRPEDSAEPDLLADVRKMLRSSHPWELLAFTSGLLAMVDERGRDPFQRARGDEPEGPSLQDLLESFIEVRVAETTALLAVLLHLVPDDLSRRRIRRELSNRADRLPGWLTDLAPLRVERALQMSHVLGDGDNIAVGVRTGAGDAMTAMVYVDHNLGTLVKDAFVAADPIEVLAARFEEASAADPDVEVRDLDLADARPRVSEAVDLAAMTFPPLETETWPACRALLEWIVLHLPEGGAGYERPEWDEDARADLVDRFLESPHGRAHARGEDANLVDSLVWFGCDYGPGDPLRWSPVAVEILLTDWLPRKVIADAEFLGRAPDVLRSFIRFAHAEKGIREKLTVETLAAVDRWEPQYRSAINASGAQGPAALFAAMGLLDEEPWDHREGMRGMLREAVGGEAALASLDTGPLPDEPFDWDGIPEDVHGRVRAVVALTDRCCEELLDGEFRTACRRLLADVARGEPEIFRRRARTDTAAATLVWIVVKANEGFAQHAGGLTAKALAAWFGLPGSPSQRAPTMLGAIGVRRQPSAGTLYLGTPRYLVSERRRSIVDRRDRF